jgi:three-Cys-motif partner protein
MQVAWQTIEALAATKAIELFINFPVGMAIQRLLRRQVEKFTDAQRRRLDDYFGSPDWKGAVYQPEQTLFGGDDEQKVHRSGEKLVTWYRNRLGTLFSHVSRAALIRNTRRGHLYYLLLASHNAVGVKIANEILSAGELV